MTITFKQFIKDYAVYYGLKKGENFTIESYRDFAEVIYCLYDKYDFEIHYNDKEIEVW